MKIKLSRFIFSGLLLCSCGGNYPSEAVRSIENGKMRELLLDLHLAQADLDRDSDWRSQAFSDHQVDSTKFHETLRYYAAHPDSAQGVYDWVQDQLAERREMILAKEREMLREEE